MNLYKVTSPEHNFGTEAEPDINKAITEWHGTQADARKARIAFEQPFKDTADTPNEAVGWSPERCRQLGRANLDALHAVIDELR